MQHPSHGRGPLLVPLAFALVLLAGCGQKGDLYLPDEPQELAAVSVH
jgi:predicted small lipoprotein YifL